MKDLSQVNFPVPYHPTWEMTDSSKIQAFMDCPRRVFYEYILGWRLSTPNNHLIFGDAWHQALEHMLINGYSSQSLMEAHDKFTTVYRATLPESTDDIYFPKTPDMALKALAGYAGKYEYIDKAFTVLYTEVGGKVAISDDRMLSFRMDAICEGERGVFFLEHKTTGRSFSRFWTDQWTLSFQVGTYLHALHCIFPTEEVVGALINGVSIMKTKTDFLRIPVEKNRRQMEMWLENALFWVDSYYNEIDMLCTCSDEDNVLHCFPMNTQNCTKYTGCPYHDFCCAWQNPLQHLDRMPSGFEVHRWDPNEKKPKHEMELKLPEGER